MTPELQTTQTVAPKSIGIVAVSPEGTRLFYAMLMRLAGRRFGWARVPDVAVHGRALGLYIDRAEAGDWVGVADLLVESSERLAAAGCAFVLCPDHVVQPAIHLAEERSPVPWLRMTGMVADRVVAAGYETVGVLGTREAMFGSAYQTVLGLRGVKVQVPSEIDAAAVHDAHFAELIFGVASGETKRRFREVVGRLADAGSQAAIIASSEIPLALDADGSRLPLVDANEVLALGALDRAAGG
ncbi:MAG: aspartate/glutamate racemase family protein [Planctomycetota bacterium]